jgi:AcrR family transcriptional regulator
MATDTRERLVTAGVGLFQRQGLVGTGIKQILNEADAQFSSLYHHFPGGKDELATQVIRRSGADYQQHVEAAWDAAPDLVSGVRAVFEGAAAVLEATDYADACPIATVALEVASTNEPLRVATAEVFDAWVDAATARFTRAGLGKRSRRLALNVVALLEGAFVLCRATRSTEAMLAAADTAASVVKGAIPRR